MACKKAVAGDARPVKGRRLPFLEEPPTTSVKAVFAVDADDEDDDVAVPSNPS
jgi:hypothetical protein